MSGSASSSLSVTTTPFGSSSANSSRVPRSVQRVFERGDPPTQGQRLSAMGCPQSGPLDPEHTSGGDCLLVGLILLPPRRGDRGQRAHPGSGAACEQLRTFTRVATWPCFDPTPIGRLAGGVRWVLVPAPCRVLGAIEDPRAAQRSIARHVTSRRRFRLRNLCCAPHKFRYANLIVI